MTYSDTLSYLYASTPAFHQVGAAAYKPGLDNTRRLLAHLKNPERKWRSVHVAGTNGKGSTCHLLAAVLQSAGYRVGLYTSPHLVDFRERIRVNGEMIPEQEVVRFVEENKELLEQIRPSFFETTMAMAFLYFAQQQVDIAVVEVGLGGRLDSTNVVLPEVSVVTNIGFDHTEFLGDTLAKIAAEKAGIIKPHVPVVIGERQAETETVFQEKAAAMQAPLLFADTLQVPPALISSCQLRGRYQQKNIRTVFATLGVLREQGYKINDEAIMQGMAHVCDLTGLQGRWQEKIVNGVRLLFDTGHNSHGVSSYAADLNDIQHLRVVFGMVQDKDIEKVLQLLPQHAFYYWTQAKTQRAVAATTMQQTGAAYGLRGEAFGSVRSALLAALENSTAADTVFIGGSNYVVGEALEALDKLNR